MKRRTELNMSAQRTGQKGEAIAAQYLRQQGYEIVQMNWRCRLGEIDVIAQQGDTLIFIEVKTRHAVESGDALASITPLKGQKLVRAAHYYLNTQGHDPDVTLWRLDAIAVVLHAGQTPQIEHVEDALGW